MPIDYRIPYEIGSQRSKIIDPATLASLREKVAARQQDQLLANQKYEADQQELQRTNMLRQLLPRVVSPEGQVDQNALGQYIQAGGDPREAADYRRAIVGPQDTARWTVPKTVPNVVRDGVAGQLVMTPEGDTFEPYPDKPAPVVKPAPAPKPKAISPPQAKAADAVRKLETTAYVLDTYANLLNTKGAKILDPELDSAYTALAMEVKTLAELGALSGPDLALVNSMLTPPSSIKGQAYGASGLMKQLDIVRKRIDFAKNALLKGAAPGEITIGADHVNGGATAAPVPQGKRPPLSSLIKVR